MDAQHQEIQAARVHGGQGDARADRADAHAAVGGTDYVIVPGQPDQSQLYYRMSIRDLVQMPPACTKVVDTTGLATIRAWITGL